MSTVKAYVNAPRNLFPPSITATPSDVTGPRTPFSAWIAWATICLIWGTTFLAIRVAIETIPTLLVSGLRFVGAGALMVCLALATRARFPRTAAAWFHQIASGVILFAIGNTLVVYAEHTMTSGFAALLSATIPIWMAVLQAVTRTSPMTRRKAVGLAVGFSGVALLVAPAIGHPDVSLQFFLGVGAMQLSAIAWNSGTLYLRKQSANADPMAMASIQMLSGGLAVTLVAVLNGSATLDGFSTRSVVALAYLGVFGSVVAYSAYLYALSHLSPGKVSSYAYVNPIIAVFAGALAIGEPVTLTMLIAMAVVLGGVALIQKDKEKA